MKATLLCIILPVLLSSCAASEKHLVFFTNTSVGLDVGFDQASGVPMKVVIGYKRQEGVINPVYDARETITKRPQSCQEPTEVRVTGSLRGEAYSVIAKYAGSAEVKDQAEVSNAQWFATGRAADYLAQAPGIAGAVTGNSKVAEAAAKEGARIIERGVLPMRLESQYVDIVLGQLESDAKKSPRSAAVMAQVNDFAKDYAVITASFAPEEGDLGPENIRVQRYKSIFDSDHPWKALPMTLEDLRLSIATLDAAFLATEADTTKRIKLNGRELNPSELAELRRERAYVQERLDAVDLAWRKSAELLAAMNRFMELAEGQ